MIYRGYDIERVGDEWLITKNGEEGLFDPQPSEEAAQSVVDAQRRAEIRGEAT